METRSLWYRVVVHFIHGRSPSLFFPSTWYLKKTKNLTYRLGSLRGTILVFFFLNQFDQLM